MQTFLVSEQPYRRAALYKRVSREGFLELIHREGGVFYDEYPAEGQQGAGRG